MERLNRKKITSEYRGNELGLNHLRNLHASQSFDIKSRHISLEISSFTKFLEILMSRKRHLRRFPLLDFDPLSESKPLSLRVRECFERVLLCVSAYVNASKYALLRVSECKNALSMCFYV